MSKESELRSFKIMKVDLSDTLNKQGHNDYFIIQSKSKNSLTKILGDNATAIVLWVLLLIGYIKRDSLIKNEVLPISFFLIIGAVLLGYSIISFLISRKNHGWTEWLDHYNSLEDAQKELEKIIAKDDLHYGIKKAPKSNV
jgi:hypothetical protein